MMRLVFAACAFGFSLVAVALFISGAAGRP
jgi:hypothetical protein